MNCPSINALELWLRPLDRRVWSFDVDVYILCYRVTIASTWIRFATAKVLEIFTSQCTVNYLSSTSPPIVVTSLYAYAHHMPQSNTTCDALDCVKNKHITVFTDIIMLKNSCEYLRILKLPTNSKFNIYWQIHAFSRNIHNN